jgi:hypothetical protein
MDMEAKVMLMIRISKDPSVTDGALNQKCLLAKSNRSDLPKHFQGARVDFSLG